MFASITSVALVGVEPRPVRVEVHLGGAKDAFSIVGLPDTAVREAKDRVRAALVSNGYDFPLRRITVNLSPADLPKAGSAYDLPIALALIQASEQVPRPFVDAVALGELALDGAVRPVVGALAAALVARVQGTRCILPPGAAGSVSLAGHEDVVVAGTLAEAVSAACGDDTGRGVPPAPPPRRSSLDLAEVRGQPRARRALEIAAAGGHHLWMKGPPGSGKTMLARCLPTLLPPLDGDAVLDVALAWSAAGLDRAGDATPPFRSPHHSATLAAMVGGGSGTPVPGEVTLADHGVLFLDELGEFPVGILDALRQPVEDGSIVIARKGSAMRFPSRFQLVAATNPCPCGYGMMDNLTNCECSQAAKARYRRRFSGPLLDRFDLRIDVPRLEPEDLAGPPGESSAEVRARIGAARKRQQARGKLNRLLSRAELDSLDFAPAADARLLRVVRDLRLTARGWDRLRRVAVTIADLNESSAVGEGHVAEALTLRSAS